MKSPLASQRTALVDKRSRKRQSSSGLLLTRRRTPARFGDWSYEPIDAKLARETKAGAILQLCVYADLLTHAQESAPEYMHVVAPWTDFKPFHYRFADYAAYFRRVQRGLEASLLEQPSAANYRDPKEHCDVCRWWVGDLRQASAG